MKISQSTKDLIICLPFAIALFVFFAWFGLSLQSDLLSLLSTR